MIVFVVGPDSPPRRTLLRALETLSVSVFIVRDADAALEDPAAAGARLVILAGPAAAEEGIRAWRSAVSDAAAVWAAAGADIDIDVERLQAAGADRCFTELDGPTVTACLRETLDAAGLDAEVRRVEGDPGSRLVEIAEHEGFDQIVIGGGQTSPMGKIKIGQVAEFVLMNADTTVTLVR